MHESADVIARFDCLAGTTMERTALRFGVQRVNVSAVGSRR
jgi:hypothetical protein